MIPAWAFYSLVGPGLGVYLLAVLLLALLGASWAWFQFVRLVFWASSRIRTNRRRESTSRRRAW